jgi:NDP-sugar pyrophosphorylase family protein
LIKTAFILAAGFGTRMKPWTYNIPKPLLSMGKKPLIAWHLEKLISYGISHILINIHHLGYKLQSFADFYFHERLKPAGVKFTILPEEQILGTGGALFQAKEFIKDDDFFLINSDIVYGLDLKKLSSFHEKHGQIATLAVQKTLNEKLKQVSIDETGLVEKIAWINYCENPKPANHAFIGIHAINRRIFNFCTEKKEQCIIRYTYPAACKCNEKLMALETDAYWRDMGDIDGFERLHRDLLEGRINTW